MTHSIEDANTLIEVLKKTWTKISVCEVKLIGSLSKGFISSHDIDILIDIEKTEELVHILIKLLQPVKFETTDWGSLFLHETPFGNVDIFFKGQTDNFDF